MLSFSCYHGLLFPGAGGEWGGETIGKKKTREYLWDCVHWNGFIVRQDNDFPKVTCKKKKKKLKADLCSL